MVEEPLVDALRDAMANEHAPGNPHGERTSSQERQKRLPHELALGTVHLLQPHAKQDVEHLPVLLDRIVGDLGQLVVAQEKMDAIGKVDLHPRNVLQDGVGHASTILRIRRAAVTDLLHHQMPTGQSFQGGNSSDEIEIPPVAVQIAGQHHVIGGLRANVDHVSHAASGRQIQIGCLVKHGERVFNVFRRGNHVHAK